MQHKCARDPALTRDMEKDLVSGLNITADDF